MKVNHTISQRIRREIRTRAKVRGTADRPRLTVFRSNETTYLQVIDDAAGKTLVAATKFDLKEKTALTKMNEAVAIAKVLADKAKKAKINALVFDRGGYKYHGRVKAIADTVRAEGIQV